MYKPTRISCQRVRMAACTKHCSSCASINGTSNRKLGTVFCTSYIDAVYPSEANKKMVSKYVKQKALECIYRIIADVKQANVCIAFMSSCLIMSKNLCGGNICLIFFLLQFQIGLI